MKKTLFAVLVCTLMTLTLTGCGSKVETDNRVGNVSIEELNDINKKSVAYTNNLLSTQRMEDELRTAHARTDIEATPEGIQSDLDIMNDDSLWD